MVAEVVVAATVEVDTAEVAVADVEVSSIFLPPFVPSLMGLTKVVVGRRLYLV